MEIETYSEKETYRLGELLGRRPDRDRYTP